MRAKHAPPLCVIEMRGISVSRLMNALERLVKKSDGAVITSVRLDVSKRQKPIADAILAASNRITESNVNRFINGPHVTQKRGWKVTANG